MTNNRQPVYFAEHCHSLSVVGLLVASERLAASLQLLALEYSKEGWHVGRLLKRSCCDCRTEVQTSSVKNSEHVPVNEKRIDALRKHKTVGLPADKCR